MNKAEIEKWLKRNRIEKYIIHPNLVVDVDDNVSFSYQGWETLPFQLGHVTGYFGCSNNQLTSLKNCPRIVDGDFWCDHNKPHLKSLEYFPNKVGGLVNCENNKFEVTNANAGSWIRAIKTHKDVYQYIQDKATDRMTAIYEMRWIP